MDTVSFNENNNQPTNYTPNNNKQNKFQRSLHFIDSEFRTSSPLVLKLLLFLIGFLGFQVIGFILSLGLGIFIHDQLLASALINLVSYILTAIILFSLLSLIGGGKYLKIVFSGFKHGSIYMWGFLLLGLALLIETILSLINTSIINASFGDIQTSNLNESSINEILNSGYGFLMFAPIIILAPFVEEFTYRLGLMDLIGKRKKVAGLIVSSIVFGVLHFNGIVYLIMFVSKQVDPAFDTSMLLGQELSTEEILQSLAVEFLNLPIYILMGMCLGLAYLYSGNVVSSIVAHVSNNTLSVIVTLLNASTISYVLPEFLVKYADITLRPFLMFIR